MTNNLNNDEMDDLDFLNVGSLAEIIAYPKKSSIKKNKAWLITEYDKSNDYVKIVSLSGKKSYRIESWRIVPIKFDMDKEQVKNIVLNGGYMNIDTDEE